jgi:hypothetical protein
MYKISEMTIGEYKEFLDGDGKSKKYRIKLKTNKNGILMQNLKNAKPFMLGCVKEYYSPTKYQLTGVTDCFECKRKMQIDTDSIDCLECHKKCFDKYNNRQLNRIINKTT